MFLEYNMNITESSYRYNTLKSELSAKSPFNMASCGYLECLSRYMTKRSGLDEYLIIYTLSGRGELLYNNQVYALGKNSVFVIDCNKYQEYKTKLSPWKFYYIHVYGDSFKKLFSFIEKNDICCLDIINIVEIADTFKKIIDLKILDRAEKYVEFNSLIVGLIYLLYRESMESNEIRKVNNYIVQNAIEYMQENYLQDISIDKICENISISKFHFIKIFKKITGITPYNYIKHLKVCQAKKSLTSTDLSVEEIGYRLNYLNTSSFIKMFKSETGLTPLEFRKSSQIKFE